MTISTTTSRVQFAGNDSTTIFACGFTVIDEDHLEVYLDGTLKTKTTHYTVSGVPGSASVTMLTAPATGETLTILRVVPLTQLSDYINGGDLDVEVLEDDLDLLAMKAQQLNEVDSRSLKLPATTEVSDPATSSTLPDFTSADGGKTLMLNAGGTAITYGTPTSETIDYVAGDAGKPIGVNDTGAGLEARTDLTLTTLKGTSNNPVDMEDGIKADTVAERTAGAGVTLDSVLLKDGYGPFMPMHIQGITISNDDAADGDDINFAAGSASTYSSDGTRYNTIAAAGMTKQADATWAAGDDAGGMASGVSWAASTDYHLFLLGKQNDQSAYDYGFDTSLTAANLLADAAVVAAGFNTYRRVTSMRSSSTPGWPGITTRELAGGGLEVLLSSVTYEFTKSWSGGTDDTAQTGTLATPPGGVKVDAILKSILRDTTTGAGSGLLMTSLDQTDVAVGTLGTGYNADVALPGAGATVEQRAVAVKKVRLSTSRTFRYRAVGTTTDHTAYFALDGWIDDRR